MLLWPSTDTLDDIVHIPYDDSFEKRINLPLVDTRLTELPSGFPAEVRSTLAWEPQDFEDQQHELRLDLSGVELEELMAAVQNAKKNHIASNKLTISDFPLPMLARKLEAMNRIVLEGHGFCILGGLDPAAYSPEDNVLLQAGLCCYFGDKRAMQYHTSSGFGPALVHVTDLSNQPSPDPVDNFLLPVQNEGAIGFHNDQGDTISLYCRKAAKEGGELYLSSGYTIYNELAAKHPNVLRTLTNTWQWQQERRAMARPMTTDEPLVHIKDGRLIWRFMKAPLTGSEGSPRHPKLDPLTASQIDAIKVVDSIAYKHAIGITLREGDVAFFNNLALLHARNKYVDEGKAELKRHMTRIIVRDSANGWTLPEMLQEQWRHWYDHDPAWELLDELPSRTWTNHTYGNQGHG